MKIDTNNLRTIATTIISVVLLSCNGGNNNAPANDSTIHTEDSMVSQPSGISAPTTFIDDGGSGGVPVLFVHSFGGSTLHWSSQLEHLRKTRRAIAFDLRGHGQSTAPADSNYTVDAFSADIATVADSLRLDKFILVGHSLGGAAAIAYAGKYPDRVKGLVLVGTPGKTPPTQVEQIMASLQSEKYDTVMKDYMKRLLKNARPFTDSLEKTGMQKLDRATTLKIIRAVFDFDPVPVLKKYSGPVLIIGTPAENQPGALHTLFPAIKYQVVPGTSHWIQLDKPEQFNKMLDQFLSKNG